MASSESRIDGDRYISTLRKHEASSEPSTSATEHLSELSQLGRLKSDLDNTIGRLRSSLGEKNLSETQWKKVIELRQETRAMVHSANNKINTLMKTQSPATDRVMGLQLQRYRRIFDQMTGDLNILSKQLDQRYQSFILFNDNRHVTQKRGNAINTGKVVVEAIMDVESLTEQASMNVDILKRGNERMTKIYNRLNTMVHEHLFDIKNLQTNINYMLIRNRTVTSVVMGVCLFFIIHKLILSKII